MRPIDADRLMEIIRPMCGKFTYNGFMIDYQRVMSMIDSAPTIDAVNEWIPCSKRLPSNFSEDETVLATTDVDGDRVIAMFALDVKSFYLKGYVSAWMPLPTPWKGADDE